MAQQGEQQRRSKRLRLAEPGAEEEDAAGAAPPAPSASSGQAPAAAASAAEGAVVAEADAEQQAVAPAEAEEPGITRLERLAQPVDHMGAGLSKADLKSLVEHGIHCVETIAFMPMRKLLDVQGIGEAKATAVRLEKARGTNDTRVFWQILRVAHSPFAQKPGTSAVTR
ncbi:unnamed protein product [Prorocentrum cordatum]|uniref:DNA repair protein RAD51 homolog n=1 Tax=Prorocentrum cordatum TaxID=2364126 RepID=A0ABN9UFA1_9DINO|nr:unnamed protein product [Polarella glacialis]